MMETILVKLLAYNVQTEILLLTSFTTDFLGGTGS